MDQSILTTKNKKMIKLNIDRVDLIYQLGKNFPNGKGVEVGSFKGEFAKEICQLWDGH